MFVESDAYERFMGRWSAAQAALLAQFAQVRDGERLLDVGCGTGSLALELATRFPRSEVTGVDPSEGYLGRARARVPRARFVVGDARRLPLPSESFDGVLSLLALNFVPDPVAAVRELVRVLQPGGVAAAAVWDYGEGMEMLRKFWDAAAELDPSADALDERRMRLCRRGELGRLWREAGFEETTEQSLESEQRFSSFDDYWQPFLGGQGPAGAYVASLTAPARERLASALRARLGTGAFTLRARTWAVRGVLPGERR